VVLSSDEEVFGGWRNVTKDSAVDFYTQQGDHDNRPNSMLVSGGGHTAPPQQLCTRPSHRHRCEAAWR
jgi:hypothetical protein